MKRLAALGASAVVVVAMAAPATAKQDKVWVCHATPSVSNPWVLVHVSTSAWENGHGGGGPALQKDVDMLVEAYPGIHQGPAPALVCDGGMPQ
jgi:hypothetical protein